MAELNNIPEADDTKTRVTAKVTEDTPGKTAPSIDLDTPKKDDSTMTRRTLKLSGLAGLTSTPPPAEKAAEKPAEKPAEEAEDDTRTRRTLKLSSLANAPSIKAMNLNKPVSAPASPETPAAGKPSGEKIAMKTTAADTVTRRTQKLEALDTQDVIAMTEVQDAEKDTSTLKLSAPANAPVPPKTRQTVKVDGIAPAHTPVIDLDAKPGDTNTRKTVKFDMPDPEAPDIDLDAEPADDTQTRKSTKVEAPAPAPKFKSSNVDDTVKLQRPAPRPAMPGSVAPAAQGNKSAAGGIKLNKPSTPKSTPKSTPEPPAAAPQAAPAAAPQAAPEPASTAAPAAAPAAAPKAAPAAAPQAAPQAQQNKSGLKVNHDAIKNLGSAPMTQNPGAAPMSPGAAGMPMDSQPHVNAPRESLVLNIIFTFFGVLAALIMIFIAVIAASDYINVWMKNSSSPKMKVPLVSDYIQKGNQDVDETKLFKGSGNGSDEAGEKDQAGDEEQTE